MQTRPRPQRGWLRRRYFRYEEELDSSLPAHYQVQGELSDERCRYRQVLVLYLRRPSHDRYSNRGALEGRVRYSDLKEAAPRGSLWVLYMVEQVLMICKVVVGGCARQLQREIVRFEAADRG